MSDYLEVLNNMSFCLLMAFALRLGWDYKETWRMLFCFWNWLFDGIAWLFTKLSALLRKRKP